MTVHFNGRNGTETLLCDVVVVLNIDAFLCQRAFRGEGFGSKYKPYFTWEIAEEFTRCLEGIIHLFFIVFCPIASLQCSIVKLKIIATCIFLDYKWTKLERGSQQTHYYKTFFKAVFGKVFYTNAQMLWGLEAFSFHFCKPFSFKFWVLGELERANFWFWVVFLWSSLWTWNQNSFKFPAFLELTDSDVTSFISSNYPTVFPTAVRLWRIKNSDFNIPISQQCFVQFV